MKASEMVLDLEIRIDKLEEALLRAANSLAACDQRVNAIRAYRMAKGCSTAEAVVWFEHARVVGAYD